MKMKTWFLWIPTIPYVLFTSLLLATPGEDRWSGYLFLINAAVLVVGTTLSHTTRTIRPSDVSGFACLAQALITAAMIILKMGDAEIILSLNGGICGAFGGLTILYSASLRARLKRMWESVWKPVRDVEAKVMGTKRGRTIALIAVSFILVGLAVVGSDYLEVWGSTADYRDTLIALPLGGFACIDEATRQPIVGVEMALSDAAGFQSTETYPVRPVEPRMMSLSFHFVPGFCQTRLFKFTKKIASPTITCHFLHPDYETATVTLQIGDLGLGLSPTIVAMKPKRTQ